MRKRKRNRYFDKEGRLIVKPYRIVDLCAIFDVSYRTLRSWIDIHVREIGERIGKYYTAIQVERMLIIFGRPCYVEPAALQKG